MSVDPEKGESASHSREETPSPVLSSSSLSSDSSHDALPRLAPLKMNQSCRSLATQQSDAFDNLEYAVTNDLETEAERQAREPITYTRTGTSVGSAASRPPDFEVVFEDGDPEHPRNWPLWYRTWSLAAVSYSTLVTVVWSTSYTASSGGLSEMFGSSYTITTLGLTSYLLGLATGSLVLAPMSELYGRRIVYLVCLSVWGILVIPCGLANSLTTLIVVRYFAAIFGAAMISNGPGSVVDVADPEYLALAFSLWSIAPLNGPVIGPIVGGFVYEYAGWRWGNWVVLILAGIAVAWMFTVKETYGPTILKRKTARIRKETDDPRWWCQYDQKVSSLHLIKINLSRPFILFATEPILWFMNLWISVTYGILYLCFVAYPIVFQQERGWSVSIASLAFLGIGLGTMIGIVTEPLWRRLINSRPRDPVTGKIKPESQALIMSIGAVLTPLGQLAFSWTCLPISIHWIVPIMCGIPFGMGNFLGFIYSANYMAGAYGIYAASALAGNAVIRSVFGGVLPLAGPKMYEALSPQWAGTLLGLLEVMLIPVPVVLWRYGHKIRANSRAVRQIREEQDLIDAKRANGMARLERKRLAKKTKTQEALREDDDGVLVEERATEDEQVNSEKW